MNFELQRASGPKGHCFQFWRLCFAIDLRCQQAEILVLQGRRQVGGRKPTVVVGDRFEAELSRVIWSWDRWLAIHMEANKDLSPKLQKETESLQWKLVKLLSLLDATRPH